MVRNDVRDTMKRPSKSKHEQHEYLHYEEVEVGKKYIDQVRGILEVTAKHKSNGRKILFVKSPNSSYEMPYYFEMLKLKK